MVLLVPAETPPVSWQDRWQSFSCWCNLQPQLTIRRIIWILTAGWYLLVCYGAAALLLAVTLVFIPFVRPALQLAGFAFDPIGKHAVPHERLDRARCNTANLVWSILFGWLLTLLLLVAVAVQMMTIIGIPTALRFIELAKFTLRPFGKDIVPKRLPTSVDELRPRRPDLEGQQPNLQMGSTGQPLRSQNEPMSHSFA